MSHNRVSGLCPFKKVIIIVIEYAYVCVYIYIYIHILFSFYPTGPIIYITAPSLQFHGISECLNKWFSVPASISCDFSWAIFFLFARFVQF